MHELKNGAQSLIIYTAIVSELVGKRTGSRAKITDLSSNGSSYQCI